MPLKKWRSMDIFNFSPRENPIMESISNKFAEISQSHAGSLLRNRRLGSLGSVSGEQGLSLRRDDVNDNNSSGPLLQRTAIIQKDDKGYGLTVSGDNPVFVASIKPGGAAEKAGVQVGDKIMKVNGKLVMNSNHTEVVKMIRSGSYVALALLGKPAGTHAANRESPLATTRESVIEHDTGHHREPSGSFRNSITGPQPVDAEKERDLKQQKVTTIRVMYETACDEFEQLKRQSRANPSDTSLQNKVQEKEKTLKILEAQLQSLQNLQANIYTREQKTPLISVDSESLTSDTTSVSSWLSGRERKQRKHSSTPGAMFSPSEAQERSGANVCRSKSDVSTRKNALSEYSFGQAGYKRTESSPERSESFRRKLSKPKMSIRKTASVPVSVSDLGSDSPQTSPSNSPTPLHSQNLEIDPGVGDSGIEDGSQNSIVMTTKPVQIIGMDDDDFASEDESSDYERRSKPVSPFLSKLQNFETGDSKVFSDLKLLESKPAHMAIFLHYVLNHHDPAALLFYQLTSFYNNAQGSCKDLKKWAYEIHSTFMLPEAPLKVHLVKDFIVQEIDNTLSYRSEKEDLIRTIFYKARTVASEQVQSLLGDLRQKKEQGLIEGSSELKDHMDKNEESKIVEKYLISDLEKRVNSEENDKMAAEAWAIATFLRQVGVKTSSHSNVLERVPSFVTKDKQMSKFKFSGKSKTKNHKGHQFVLSHLYKQENCLHCEKHLWGVGFQGYQCQSCEHYIHRHCVDDLTDSCVKKRRQRPVSALNVFKPKQSPQATPMMNDDREQVGSPTATTPTIITQPLKEPDDKDLTAFKDGGHSVGSIINRFEHKSPERESPNRYNKFRKRRSEADFSPRHTRKNAISSRKNSDIGRSESMKGRGDLRDRPQKRSNSDLAMDENTLKALTSASSSQSSLRSMESPSTSMDTLTAQIQDDSDFDVEPELPSLKQVLGEETVRKLKPKEKKRQDVINELFYTEKCHVRSLKIMDKLFYRPMFKEPSIPQEFTKSLFPNLETMTALHGSLNNAMKNRRKEKPVIAAVGDILLQRFDGEAGENFRNGCAIFCRNQSHTLEALKARVRKEQKMAQLLSDAENNPLCQRLALKDIIPKQFMRLTKYPLLIENLLKYTPTNTEEYSNLERALKCSKHILEYVNQAVKDCENHQRLIDLQRRIDKKAIDAGPDMEDLRTFDLSKHKLVHDGSLIWNINNRKQIELHVVLLERAMVLLQKQDDRLVLKLQSTQLVAGKTDSKKHSPLLWLNNVLARNDATDKKAFFVVNTSQAGPQIYKLVAATAEEQRIWTKYITQASEAVKKNEINMKKKPPAEALPTEQSANDSGGENLDMDTSNLVHPEDVTYSDPVINTAVQVITPLEKLRHNDEQLAAVLEERQGLIAELLNVNPNDVSDRVQEVENDEDAVPQELIAACQHQTSEIVQMMRESTPPVLKPDSGEQVESVEDLSLPIPMERLRDMANRMNQILTNLLAAVNSRDEERDRLRKELKFAQEELNRLRRIQRLQMEAQKDKGEGGEGEEKPERPASLVSEPSTISESEGEEIKTDSEQTDEIETEIGEDNMPGLPIEPEILNEMGPLNEVLPGTMDTLIDTESPLDLAEASGTDNDETSPYEEAEIEAVEEELHEAEPPDEDQMEDYDAPIVRVDSPDSDESDESDNDTENEDDQDDDDDDDDTTKDEAYDSSKLENNVDGNIESIDRDISKEMEEQTSDNNYEDTENGNDAIDVREDVTERLKAETVGDSDTNKETVDERRDSNEEYQDAEDGEEETVLAEVMEDPGGEITESGTDNVSAVDGSENVSNKDNILSPDFSNKDSSNNNEKTDLIQTEDKVCSADTGKCQSEIDTDSTVTGLNELASSEEV